MATQPQLIDFSRLSSIAGPHEEDMRDYFFLNPEMGMVRSGPKVFRMITSHLSPPFIIDDHRFGIVTQGATVTINLQEKTLRAGMMAFLAPGSIITDIHFSPDFDVKGLALFSSYPLPFPADRLPGIFNGEVRDFQCPANDHLLDITHRLMDLIWLMVTSSETPDRPTLNNLIAALMSHYDSVYHACERIPSYSREQTIYDRFIYLVSRYAKQEHHLAFYADKMCLTERYLGSVVRQVSGLTAKQWIDKSLIACLQAELRHSDKTLAQLADEMNFPNTSFLCKYFKRLTTLSPLAYRNGSRTLRSGNDVVT
ncbi:MAG: AraC family transcriptional regulator [Paludibacteraceae bacterium]|nr:AraC family transcriptional regulator [Paludibacteraceae bacterium]